MGFFGTLTLSGGRFPVPENARLFVLVGLCGGFTTFSSFSLHTFDMARTGDGFRAAANVTMSVGLCFISVALGHMLAGQSVAHAAIIVAKVTG
jgi:fluoride exporter